MHYSAHTSKKYRGESIGGVEFFQPNIDPFITIFFRAHRYFAKDFEHPIVSKIDLLNTF